eukprot:gene21326-28259_t
MKFLKTFQTGLTNFTAPIAATIVAPLAGGGPLASKAMGDDEWCRIVDLQNEAGLQPLHFAVWGAQEEAASVLLNRGARLLGRATADSVAEALLIKARGNHEQMEAFNHDDPRQIRDNYGYTPYELASTLKRDAVVDVLDPTDDLPPPPQLSENAFRQNSHALGGLGSRFDFVQRSLADAKKARSSVALPTIPPPPRPDAAVALSVKAVAVVNADADAAVALSVKAVAVVNADAGPTWEPDFNSHPVAGPGPEWEPDFAPQPKTPTKAATSAIASVSIPARAQAATAPGSVISVRSKATSMKSTPQISFILPPPPSSKTALAQAVGAPPCSSVGGTTMSNTSDAGGGRVPNSESNPSTKQGGVEHREGGEGSVQADLSIAEPSKEDTGQDVSGTPEKGDPKQEGSGIPQGVPKQDGSGTPQGDPKQEGSGTSDGDPKQDGSGTPQGDPKQEGSGTSEGDPKQDGSGTPQGDPKQDGSGTPEHSLPPPSPIHEVHVVQPPNEFFCAITTDLMVDPVKASNGRSYERVAIEMWIKLKCPVDGQRASCRYEYMLVITCRSYERVAIEMWIKLKIGGSKFPDGSEIEDSELAPNADLKQQILNWKPFELPCKTPACTAAPNATTSSGSTPSTGCIPVTLVMNLLTHGMPVAAPTNTTPVSFRGGAENLLGADDLETGDGLNKPKPLAD